MKSSVAIATAAITELTNATARIGARSVTADEKSLAAELLGKLDTTGWASTAG